MKYQAVDMEEETLQKKPSLLYKSFGVFRCWWLFILVPLVVLPAVITGVAVKNSDKTAAAVVPNIAECLKKNLIPRVYKTENSKFNTKVVWIQDVTIWNGDGNILDHQDIVIEAGKIKTIQATGAVVPVDVDLVKGYGRIATPGLVDLHSHIGVYPYPEVGPISDGNEATAITFPQLRALDAVHPQDWVIPEILQGGVTTSLVLPGSANAMGGEATVIKSKVFSGVVPKVQDLLIPNAPRALKMACGENPRRNYGKSRLGVAWAFREAFDKGARLVQQQNDWCAAPSGHFPLDLSFESLGALLRGEAQAHVHCYLVEDMEMMIRMSQEFGFKITAFHHTLEAWKIPELLAANNITAATFADHWGFKVEAFDSTVYAPSILHKAGVKVALKSDHPVTYAQNLMYNAARAHHYGLPREAAIASVTLVPARTLGLDNRIGNLAVGHEADVVIWDREPLTLGAKPDKVLIDGLIVVDNALPVRAFPPNPTVSPIVARPGLCNFKTTFDPQVLSCYFVDHVRIVLEPGNEIEDGTIVVSGGLVSCAKKSGDCTVPVGCEEFKQQNGVIVPGFIDVLAHVGQIEIDQESTANDGSLSGSAADGSSISIQSVDGIRLNTRHVYAAWAGGVTVALARPSSTQLIAGTSTAFATCCSQVVGDAEIQTPVALHVNLGNRARKSDVTASISGQVHALRKLLSAANATAADAADPNPLQRVIKGEIPLLVEVDQVDLIGRVLNIQQLYPLSRIVIVGGAEAAVIASRLAAQGVGVIVRAPALRHDYDSARLTPNATEELLAAGVRVGLGVADTPDPRNLRWEAGLHAEKVGWAGALRLITSGLSDLLGLPNHVARIVPDTRASFILFDGDPLSLASHVSLVASADSVQCTPRQY